MTITRTPTADAADATGAVRHRPRTLLRRVLATAALAGVIATGMGMSTMSSASAATADTVPSWQPLAPSCYNPSDGTDIYANLAGGARVCNTGGVRAFRATTHPTVGLDVTVKRWTQANAYPFQWTTSVAQQTRYSATCSASYNIAAYNWENGDCVGVGQSDTYWHGPRVCGEYGGIPWCGDIWPDARRDFTMAAGSTYSVEQTLTWWNASVFNRTTGRYGIWQNQTMTWWLNSGGRVYSQSLSAIRTAS